MITPEQRRITGIRHLAIIKRVADLVRSNDRCCCCGRPRENELVLGMQQPELVRLECGHLTCAWCIEHQHCCAPCALAV
jgi:hypothetical protein